MSEFRTNNLKKVKQLLIVVSTYGEGDPPDKAVLFHEFIHGKRAPKLEACDSPCSRWATSFTMISARPARISTRGWRNSVRSGSTRGSIAMSISTSRPRPGWMACSMRFAVPIRCRVTAAETGDVAGGLPRIACRCPSAGLLSAGAASGGRHGDLAVAAPAYSRTNPFTSEVLENFNLNGRGSDKETHHLKLAIEGSGLCFEPGDSLGIYPHNDPQLVDDVIGYMGWNAARGHPRRQAGTAAPRGVDPALRNHASEQAVAQAGGHLLPGRPAGPGAGQCQREVEGLYPRSRPAGPGPRLLDQGHPSPRVRADAPQAARTALFDRQQLPGELGRGRFADCRIALPGP